MHGKKAEEFLEDVSAQIQCRAAIGRIREELEEHIEDRAEDFIAEGRTREEAEERAVLAMGDASAIGVMLNEVHRPRMPKGLLIGSILVMVLGILFNAVYYFQSGAAGGEDLVFFSFQNSYFYWGVFLIGLTVWKGYPWLVRYRKRILFLFFAVAVSETLLQAVYDPLSLSGFPWLFSHAVYMLDMPMLVCFVPLFAVLAYELRGRGIRGMLTAGAILAAMVFFLAYKTQRNLNFNYKFMAVMITGALCLYMAGKGFFDKNAVRSIAVMGAVFSLAAGGWLYVVRDSVKEYTVQCFNPQAEVKTEDDRWKDAYNSLVVKDMYRRARIFGQADFTSEEIRAYRTGIWMFPDMQEDSTWLWENKGLTLTDALPQHWANNNFLTFVILRFGWAAGCVLLAGLVLFYAEFWRISLQINNRLGRLISLVSAAVLSGQAFLYIAGNFGFQFGWFPVLPLLSEGTATMTANAVLAGFIISAWRYDLVIDEQYFVKRRQKREFSS